MKRLIPWLLILVGVAMMAGCAESVSDRIDGRADGAQDSATAARVAAAEKRAQAANGRASQADAAAAQARADALQAAAQAEDERAAKRRAEDEARAERARLAEVAAEKARLGWWLSAAGAACLALAAGAAALGWWLGMGRLTTGLGLGLAAMGGLALALGLTWSWLPIAAAVLLLAIIAAVVSLLVRAGNHIAQHAEQIAAVDPADMAHADSAKLSSAKDQIAAGTWTTVQRLRGRPLDEARAKLDALRRRVGSYLPHEVHG
jgi:hypothetical protein